MAHTKKLFLFASVLVTASFIFNYTVQSKAAEDEQQNPPQETLNQASINSVKVEYAPGEIVIKLKQPIEEFSEQPIDESKPTSTPTSFENINKNQLPQKLVELNDRYPINTIEKVIPQAESADKEIDKLKEKYKDAINKGEYTVDEEKVRSLDFSKVYKITLNPDVPIEEITKELSADPNIQYAEPNYISELALTPNDQYFTPTATNINQWGMENNGLGHTGWVADSDVDATPAWNITRGSASTLIAVIDSGVDSSHPDLGGGIGPTYKIIGGYNFLYDSTNINDDYGHGTHVAGIIAANIHNSIGVAGMCPNCKLLISKVFNSGGGGGTDTVISNAMYYSINNGADVINASWGKYATSTIISDAVDYATLHATIVVAAAGNGSTNTPFYPAAYGNVLSVAGTDGADKKSGFSNYDNGNGWIDVAAPATDILSTALPAPYTTCASGTSERYAYCSGTSMAAPLVAGLTGLYISAHPPTSEWDALNVLLHMDSVNSSDNINAENPSYVNLLGNGRINATKVMTVIPSNFTWCADYDWGVKYGAKGAYSGNGVGCPANGVQSWDFCVDATVLNEKYCGTQNQCLDSAHTCPHGCSSGHCLP